jgi:hypothetical protein
MIDLFTFMAIILARDQARDEIQPGIITHLMFKK